MLALLAVLNVLALVALVAFPLGILMLVVGSFADVSWMMKWGFLLFLLGVAIGIGLYFISNVPEVGRAIDTYWPAQLPVLGMRV